jgi:hypothetical protein
MASGSGPEVLRWARMASHAGDASAKAAALVIQASDEATGLLDEGWVEYWIKAGEARKARIEAMARRAGRRR